MTVAVIYATKHGSTAEIATAIAAEMKAMGYEVQVYDASDVGELPQASVYVLGSAVYAGRWRKHVRELVRSYGPELRRRAVWLFSSGPLGETGPDGEPEDLEELMEESGARAHQVFAGKLDPAVLSLTERLMVKAVKAPEGDFRDWDAIRRWAGRLAQELADPATAGTPDPAAG
jgi:menaquinone-dependent protoporphyrinogen oxidase